MSRMIMGAVVSAIGIIAVIYSLLPNVGSALLINTIGILVVWLGGLIVLVHKMPESKKKLVGLAILALGIGFTLWSFAMTDPWTQLAVNTIGILMMIIGVTVMVHDHKNHITIGLGVITKLGGLAVVVYSLIPNTPMALAINTGGILLFAAGSIISLKK